MQSGTAGRIPAVAEPKRHTASFSFYDASPRDSHALAGSVSTGLCSPGCSRLLWTGLLRENKASIMSAAGAVRSAGTVQQGLKEALIETLTAILSPVQEVRAAAEEQIKVLEVTEGK